MAITTQLTRTLGGRALSLALLLAACAPNPPPSTLVAESVLGPPRGHLVIAGGGELIGTGIVERFLELAGGTGAPIVVIPTAAGDSAYHEDWPGLSVLEAAGATNLTILHTTSAYVADSEAFTEPLAAAAGVWISGGQQWRLADAYLDTRALREIEALLGRGGVVGGSSAGASILASYLVRGAPQGNHIVMSPGHDRGFGLLRQAAIDQHLFTRRRERDLLQVLAEYPDLLGIGIDEGTAIVVTGDGFEVVGRSRVAVYDGSPESAVEGFRLLAPGSRYDMRGRVQQE